VRCGEELQRSFFESSKAFFKKDKLEHTHGLNLGVESKDGTSWQGQWSV